MCHRSVEIAALRRELNKTIAVLQEQMAEDFFKKSPPITLNASLAEFQKRIIYAALGICEGDQVLAATVIGFTPRALQAKIEHYEQTIAKWKPEGTA